MPYSNRFTRDYPGYIIFLIDQSGSTEDSMSENNRTIAENIADLVNNNITEVTKRATKQEGDEEEFVKREICFTIIGYGGKGNPEDESDLYNWNAELIMDAKFCDDIKNEYKLQRSSISNTDVYPILAPTHGGGTPMTAAFKVAYELLKRWNKSHDSNLDPVPVIINISDGEPTDNQKGELQETINKIKELKTADGSPLIMNVHLSAAQAARELKTPINEEDCYDEYSKLMFEISTEVTTDMIEHNRALRGMGVPKGGRLFISNCTDFKAAVDFIAIGTEIKQQQMR